MRRYARALAANADEAEDLVQEAVTKALTHWAQWRGAGPLRAWLFTILRNSFHHETRRRSRWRAIRVGFGGDPGGPRRGDDAAPPEPEAPRAPDPMFLSHVSAALAQLSDEQREVLVLVAVEGFSYAEAAEVTGAPIGTIMSRLSRAREKLRAATGGPV